MAEIDQTVAPKASQNTTTPLSRNGSPHLDSFDINLLPPEIRSEVFEHAILQDIHKPPILLPALSSLPDQRLHAEAAERYKHIFRSVDSSNAEDFKHERLLERLKIKHLEIISPVEFRGNTITLKNNLRVLTLDYSREVACVDAFRDPFELARSLLNASSQAKRLVFMKKKGATVHTGGSSGMRILR
jgi:hypothetical protein